MTRADLLDKVDALLTEWVDAQPGPSDAARAMRGLDHAHSALDEAGVPREHEPEGFEFTLEQRIGLLAQRRVAMVVWTLGEPPDTDDLVLVCKEYPPIDAHDSAWVEFYAFYGGEYRMLSHDDGAIRQWWAPLSDPREG